MRSYKDHLSSLQKPKSEIVTEKPVFRASSLFPVIQTPGISSRVLFMGYWLLKRNISQITAIYTLRSEDGRVLVRSLETIDSPRVRTLELQSLLIEAKEDPARPFRGSLECEFYSSFPMVFPFPATSINYYGPAFNTIVHTAERVYNDYDDMKRNSQQSVPESGFNLFAGNNKNPFFTLINGTQEVPGASIDMVFYNAEKETLNHTLELGLLKPYETKWIFPKDHVDLETFLKGKVGAAKIRFDLSWVFPRLVVGNIQTNPEILSITHTYYDCTDAAASSDYWDPEEPRWYPATLMIPLWSEQNHFTNATFYPIYSPSSFAIDVEIYSASGKLEGKKESALIIDAPLNEFKTLRLSEIAEELGINTKSKLTARLIAKGDPIPSRIKCAVDIGTKTGQFPCNICTNLQPFIPSWDRKPFTFKWCPLLSGENGVASIWIVNSSQHKVYEKKADVNLTFYRGQDSETLQKQITIPPHGLHVIERDEELDEFLGGRVGWLTATSDNPHILTYTFFENDSGVIGGDHGF